MPTSDVSPLRWLRNLGLPRNSRRFSGVTLTGVSTFFCTIRRATLRQTLPISRSRFRTPASRV